VSDKKKFMKKLIDFETRKSVHINMTRNTHSGFRKILLDYGLSMQEVFEYFASLVAENDNSAMNIIKDSYNNKRLKAIKKVTEQEADNLYDAIEQEDPFG
jgi:antitoxin component of RelBE/YafQ-DinJ toxin-antitoxin module